MKIIEVNELKKEDNQAPFYSVIDKAKLNCEDIAMNFIVSYFYP